jgi:hypothetical protein
MLYFTGSTSAHLLMQAMEAFLHCKIILCSLLVLVSYLSAPLKGGVSQLFGMKVAEFYEHGHETAASLTK